MPSTWDKTSGVWGKESIDPQQSGKKFLWICHYLKYHMMSYNPCHCLVLVSVRKRRYVFVREFEYNMGDYKANIGPY